MSLSNLPELISKYDQVIEQVLILVKDIEAGKMDAGVCVMAKDGRVDVRGLGVVEKPAQAVALLFMAIKSFDSMSQAEIMAELQAIMERSEVVAQEAHLWNPKMDCTENTP